MLRIIGILRREGLIGLLLKCIKHLLCCLCRPFYQIGNNRPIILFESVPNLSDNTKAVYDEMVRRGLNQRYHMVWMAYNDEERTLPETNAEVFDFSKNDSIAHAIRRSAIWSKVRCIICCNRFTTPRYPTQKSFYLAHGMPIKNVRNYYTMPETIDYCFATGEGLKELRAYTLKIPEEKVIPLGFPRNDVFCEKVRTAKDYFSDKADIKKVVVWYPTFRRHKSGGKSTDCSYDLPLIHDMSTAEALNDFAKKHGILLVLKPHFAQDISNIKDLGLSNILFINDDFFACRGISSYEFVAGCDALITDYSSIYYDYLLCDKPIAVIWEDIDEYRRNPGFAGDIDYHMKGAEKVYTGKELESFLLSVIDGQDNLRDARREIRDLVHYSTDGRNAERVTDFIIEKAKL